MLKQIGCGSNPLFTLALGAMLFVVAIVTGGFGAAIAGGVLVALSIPGLARR